MYKFTSVEESSDDEEDEEEDAGGGGRRTWLKIECTRSLSLSLLPSLALQSQTTLRLEGGLSFFPAAV